MGCTCLRRATSVRILLVARSDQEARSLFATCMVGACQHHRCANYCSCAVRAPRHHAVCMHAWYRSVPADFPPANYINALQQAVIVSYVLMWVLGPDLTTSC